MEVRQEIIKARTNLIFENPFFGYLSLRLKLEECKDIPTAATDGFHLLYNPDWFQELKKRSKGNYNNWVKAIIAHEVLHCALLHHLRIDNRNAELWNIACDYAENQSLVSGGFSLPDGCLINEKAYKGWTAERIYADIIKNAKMLKMSKSMQRIGDMQSPSKGKGKGDEGNDRNEGGSGTSDSWKMSKEEQERMWKDAVKQAANAAKNSGNFPAGFDYLLDGLEPAKLNWSQLLRRFVEAVAKDDYSWMYPNRRYISQGIYLPSLRSESLGDLAFFMDMSGSMSDREIKECMSEIKHVLQEFSFQNIYVLYFDTELHQVDHFEGTTFDPQFKPKGRGGTDPNPCFNWISKNKINPSCIFVLSDMEFFTNVKVTDIPIMFISTTSQGGPYGTTVYLNGEPKK